MTTDDDHDDQQAHSRGRGHAPPVTHPHRNTVARATSTPPDDADLALGTGELSGAELTNAAPEAHGHPTERLERIEQMRLVAMSTIDEPDPDCDEETRVAPDPGSPVAAPAPEPPAAPSWSRPPRRPLPIPVPPERAPAPPPASLVPSRAVRRRWPRVAALVLLLAAAGGLAGHELADRAGYELIDLVAP